MNVIVCKLFQKAVDFIVIPRRVLISNFKQLYRIAEALFEMYRLQHLVMLCAPLQKISLKMMNKQTLEHKLLS